MQVHVRVPLLSSRYGFGKLQNVAWFPCASLEAAGGASLGSRTNAHVSGQGEAPAARVSRQATRLSRVHVSYTDARICIYVNYYACKLICVWICVYTFIYSFISIVSYVTGSDR